MLLLGGAFFAWPLLLQLYDLRFMTSSGDHIARFQSYTFFCEYVMLLPFACVAQEQDRPRGLIVFAGLFTAGTAVLSWGLLRFVLGQMPDPVPEVYVWTSARINAIWNGNLTAAIMMVGIGFCVTLALLTRKRWLRCCLVLLAVIEYYLLSLADCQGVNLMLSVLAGGVGFFCVFPNHNRTWKRAVLALAAALVLCIGVHQLNGWVYGLHFDSYMNHPERYQNSEITMQREAAQNAPQIQSETEDEEKTVEDQVATYHDYRGSIGHLLTFGRRTSIWSAAIKGSTANIRNLLFGVRDIPAMFNEYTGRYYPHAHNAWLHTLLVLGIVGLAFALYFTYLALKAGILLMFFRESRFYQKLISMLTLSFMGTQLLEAQIFCGEWPTNFLNMAVLICLGYMVYWEKHTKKISFRKKD